MKKMIYVMAVVMLPVSIVQSQDKPDKFKNTKQVIKKDVSEKLVNAAPPLVVGFFLGATARAVKANKNLPNSAVYKLIVEPGIKGMVHAGAFSGTVAAGYALFGEAMLQRLQEDSNKVKQALQEDAKTASHQFFDVARDRVSWPLNYLIKNQSKKEKHEKQ